MAKVGSTKESEVRASGTPILLHYMPQLTTTVRSRCFNARYLICLIAVSSYKYTAREYLVISKNDEKRSHTMFETVHLYSYSRTYPINLWKLRETFNALHNQILNATPCIIMPVITTRATETRFKTAIFCFFHFRANRAPRNNFFLSPYPLVSSRWLESFSVYSRLLLTEGWRDGKRIAFHRCRISWFCVSHGIILVSVQFSHCYFCELHVHWLFETRFNHFCFFWCSSEHSRWPNEKIYLLAIFRRFELHREKKNVFQPFWKQVHLTCI